MPLTQPWVRYAIVYDIAISFVCTFMRFVGLRRGNSKVLSLRGRVTKAKITPNGIAMVCRPVEFTLYSLHGVQSGQTTAGFGAG